MKSKKLKFKKRRHISREQLFHKKVAEEAFREKIIEAALEKVFPDPKERQKYIKALIDGLNNEESVENE